MIVPLTLSCIARLRSIAVLGGVTAVALLQVSVSAHQVVVAAKTYEIPNSPASTTPMPAWSPFPLAA